MPDNSENNERSLTSLLTSSMAGSPYIVGMLKSDWAASKSLDHACGTISKLLATFTFQYMYGFEPRLDVGGNSCA